MSTIQSIFSIIDSTAVYFHVDTDDNESEEEDVGNGNAISSIGGPSTNVADFLKISTKSLEQWRKRRRENNEDDDDEFGYQFHRLSNIIRQQREKQNQASSRKRRCRCITPRSCKRLQPDTISIPSTEEGVDCVQISTSPTSSPWYIHYVAAPQLGHPRFNTQFRFRFRMPYHEFLILLTAINAHPLFSQWTKSDAVGSPPSPLALLLLGALRYLGRGWTFDDVFEATSVSAETHRQFFHVFLDYGSSVLFKKHVRTPTNAENVKEHMVEFEIAGFTTISSVELFLF